MAGFVPAGRRPQRKWGWAMIVVSVVMPLVWLWMKWWLYGACEERAAMQVERRQGVAFYRLSRFIAAQADVSEIPHLRFQCRRR
jgi:hypothetical protein